MSGQSDASWVTDPDVAEEQIRSAERVGYVKGRSARCGNPEHSIGSWSRPEWHGLPLHNYRGEVTCPGSFLFETQFE